jgi:hypothetical protein
LALAIDASKSFARRGRGSANSVSTAFAATRSRPGLRLSDTIKGRNDYGALRTLNVESRSLKREETPDDLVGEP